MPSQSGPGQTLLGQQERVGVWSVSVHTLVFEMCESRSISWVELSVCVCVDRVGDKWPNSLTTSATPRGDWERREEGDERPGLWFLPLSCSPSSTLLPPPSPSPPCPLSHAASSSDPWAVSYLHGGGSGMGGGARECLLQPL